MCLCVRVCVCKTGQRKRKTPEDIFYLREIKKEKEKNDSALKTLGLRANLCYSTSAATYLPILGFNLS